MAARRAAVLGFPIAHSLSPALHRAAYAALGLDWEYDAIECTAAELPRLLEMLDPSYAGLSLTMPLKEAVLPLLDAVSPLAERLGAVNTVLREPGGRLRGDNTDVAGVLAGLDELPGPLPEAAVLLGAGGTARAVVAALPQRGIRRLTVVVREPSRAAGVVTLATACGLDVDVTGWQPAPALAGRLVVNTTPAGVADRLAGGWPADALLLDVLYDPWPTAIARAALAVGAPVAGGLAVLVGQAVVQVELMTGRAPSADVLRAAGERALAGRR